MLARFRRLARPLAALTVSASAGGTLDFVNSNTERQVNWGTVYAINNFNADWIGGDLRIDSTAVGNNMSISTQGSTWMYLTQVQLAEVGAEVNANLGVVGGDVDLSSTAICNNVSTTTTKANNVHVGSDQRCETTDPYAIVNVSALSVGGTLDISAAAVANNASFTAEAASNHVSSVQINPAAVNAVVNANLGAVGGDVAVNATAIGNNLVIKHSFGTP